ncbi:hypothetical protein AMS68_000973 [Peltaster fructicola]|uniref:Glyoxalase-like domain-containing protein n=1 Tax=Peltaster fructicola TaxID=286661 RepID=A0A6H0XL66_9PEZI|nr:hypothetical protein AMS68_000973 [Peltaster fructicola]
MTTAAIDHIIVLLPYKDIVTPPTWLTDHFIISAGGRHADGLTENKLIIFEDGTYIELIAFIDDDTSRRRGHWWDKEYSIVDYALTDAGRFDSSTRDRLEQAVPGLTYAEPQVGSRTRPDGVHVEWEVTFPRGLDRGIIPFWCHDITPRERRVPRSEQAHPSGALGVSAVTIKTPAEQARGVDKALAAIIGTATTGRHEIMAPERASGTRKPYLEVSAAAEGQEHHIEISLQIPAGRSRQGIAHKVGNGVIKITFSAAA